VPEHAIRNPAVASIPAWPGSAAATWLTLDGHVAAAVNGDQITTDGQTPLATGDTVVFRSANAV
jgi:hypothetical protein